MAVKAVNTDFDMGGVSKILNLPNAATSQEPATLAQVQALVEGNNWKDSVRAASTSNINLASPGATIDGIAMATNDRFLAKDQSTQSQNGIYIWNGAATPATRALDADTFAELESAIVMVEEGTAGGGTRWRQTQVNGVIGTNNVVFVSDTGTAPAASETTAGIAEFATQAETDTGTDDTRTITPLKLKNASFVPKKFSQTFGDGSATSYVITHGLGNQRPLVAVSLTGSTFDEILCEIEFTSTSAITIKTNSAPAAGAYTVSIIG